MKTLAAYCAGIYTWYQFGPWLAKHALHRPIGKQVLQSFSPDEWKRLYRSVQLENKRRYPFP